MARVEVEQPAYLKLMLHTAKYPWAQVSGFLLGSGEGQNVRAGLTRGYSTVVAVFASSPAAY